MNCKQTQELLPLHIGGDLEGKRAQLVTAHMQSCSACDELAADYIGSRRLVQAFTPPSFDESVYSELRQNVLREIRRQPEPLAGSSLVAGLVAWLIQPRFRWVAATALLAVFGFAFYVASHRNALQNSTTLAGKQSKGDSSNTPVQTSSLQDRVELALDARASGPPTSRSNSSAAKAQKPVHSMKVLRPDVPEQTAMQSPKEPKLPLVRPAANFEKTVRLEMQTNDPNIRIIWLTHQSPVENLPGESSKGFANKEEGFK